jgi:ketosteroid isomerase-like protein
MPICSSYFAGDTVDEHYFWPHMPRHPHAAPFPRESYAVVGPSVTWRGHFTVLKRGQFASRGLGRRLATLAVGLLVVGCGSRAAARPGDDSALKDTLTARIAEAYDFTRPGLAERMIALYPDSGRVLSASGGLLTTSPDSLRAGIRAFWENTGQNMRDAHWQWDEVYVDRLGPDAAVLNGRWSIPHIAPTGRPHVLRGVWTAVFRRIGGRWLIVAEHLSAPAS